MIIKQWLNYKNNFSQYHKTELKQQQLTGDECKYIYDLTLRGLKLISGWNAQLMELVSIFPCQSPPFTYLPLLFGYPLL